MTITIYTLAAKLDKKPTKSAIYDIISMMIEDQKLPSDDELAMLYAYFMPTTSKPKTLYDWVYKAVAKNEVRIYLNAAYCDGGYIYGCNGHRLHRIKNTYDFAPGYYDQKMHKIEDLGKYPDVSSLYRDDLGEPVTLDEVVKVDGERDAYRVSDKQGLQVRYVKDALSMGDMTFCMVDDKQAAIADDGDKFAMIMPIII